MILKMTGHIPNRRSLFDIAVAGPLAGFAVALPMCILGIALSKSTVPAKGMLILGKPLLFTAIEHVLFRHAQLYSMQSIHPMALAGWLGLLLTAINLLPIGQLDGGHINYALFGRKSYWISEIFLFGFAATVFFTAGSYLGFLPLLMFINSRHPPTVNDTVSIGGRRKVLAANTLLLFILCFTLHPFR